MSLVDELQAFDQEIEKTLVEPYAVIETKSKALTNSLRRCFEEARESGRFQAAYDAGSEKKYIDLSKEELLQKLNEPFEEADFMSFREFVRLLRACSLHIGGHISGQIREAYNKTFKEDRVLLAYEIGLKESKA